MRGRFITFEGCEGSGKSSHADRLARRLEERGLDVVRTREPGGTRLGEHVRDILQHDRCEERIYAETEMLLFVACRAQLVRQIIEPALAAGKWVLCDRFADSTMAYQGYGRGMSRERVEVLNALAVGTTWPDAVLVLDLDVKTGFERLQQRNAALGVERDRMEREEESFHQRVREGYLAIAKTRPERYHVVNADRAFAAVAEDLWRAVQGLF